MPNNLWPDFAFGNLLRSPKAVIDEAGAGLESKTNGLVKFYTSGASIKNNIVEVRCSLYAPFLSYHFPFLRAQFGITQTYPVSLNADQISEVIAKDEEELTASLAKIFSAPSTIETIQKLMALAQK